MPFAPLYKKLISPFQDKTLIIKSKSQFLIIHAILRILIILFFVGMTIHQNNVFLFAQNILNIFLFGFSLYFLKRGNIKLSIDFSFVWIDFVMLLVLVLRNFYSDKSIAMDRYGNNAVLMISFVTLMVISIIAEKRYQVIALNVISAGILLNMLIFNYHHNLIHFLPYIFVFIICMVLSFLVFFLVQKIQLSEQKREILYNMLARKAEQQKLLQIKAEEANRAKNEFLTNISHEFFTPLNAITGLSNILLSHEKGDSQKEMLLQIKKSSWELLYMINEIIDLASLDNDQLPVKNEAIKTKDLLDSMKEKFMFRAGEKNIEFTVSVSENVPEVIYGDDGRIRQVLYYLCDNAVKFTTQGMAGIVCKTGKQCGGRSIEISVFDTGIGISETEKQKLFDLFTQVDGTLSRKYGGLGNGLVKANKLVQLMKGDLQVISNKDKGSVFTVILPVFE